MHAIDMRKVSKKICFNVKQKVDRSDVDPILPCKVNFALIEVMKVSIQLTDNYAVYQKAFTVKRKRIL